MSGEMENEMERIYRTHTNAYVHTHMHTWTGRGNERKLNAAANRGVGTDSGARGGRDRRRQRRRGTWEESLDNGSWHSGDKRHILFATLTLASGPGDSCLAEQLECNLEGWMFDCKLMLLFRVYVGGSV